MLQEFQEHVENCINNPPATQLWQEFPVCQVGVSRATGDDDANFGDFGRMFGGISRSENNWQVIEVQPVTGLSPTISRKNDEGCRFH